MFAAPAQFSFPDPGEQLRAQARHLLDAARRQLRGAGDEATATVNQAQQNAPEERNLLEQAWDGLTEAVGDAVDWTRDQVGDFVRGVGEGIGDGVEAVFELGDDAISAIRRRSAQRQKASLRASRRFLALAGWDRTNTHPHCSRRVAAAPR